MPSLSLHGTEFYSAPKNAGTTVRMWAKQFEAGLSERDLVADGYYTLARLGLPRIWNEMSSNACVPFFKASNSASMKWCIKRDPVGRFVSAYTDKVVHEQLAAWTVDECIDMLESGEMERLAGSLRTDRIAALHMIPQTAWLGDKKDYYQHVFDISEMDRVKDFCEAHVFKMPLGRLHARDLSRAAVNKVSITHEQRNRLMKVFEADYRAGWC